MSGNFQSPVRTVKARKFHLCDGCGHRIQKGESYITWSGKWWGDFGTMKFHPDCEVQSRKLTRHDWDAFQPGEMTKFNPAP